MTTRKLKSIISDIRKVVQTSLDDGKAINIVTIDLKGKSDVADYMVVASGTSDRHTSSLAQNLVKNIKEKLHYTHVTVEGISEGNWVLIDAGDVIIHIFKPEYREMYNLEKMWALPITEPALVH